MKKFIIFFVFFMLLGCSTGMYNTSGNQHYKDSDYGFASSWDNQDTFMHPFEKDAYGPGINSDAAGRPFQWQTQDGLKDPFLEVEPDAYGPGIGSDEYGRPVKPVPFP